MKEFLILNLALDKTKTFLDKEILKEKDTEKLASMLFSRAFTFLFKGKIF